MEERTIIIKKGSFSSFITGALIGAGVAMLLAPMSGRETRDKLTERGTEIKDKAVELAKETGHRAQATYQTARTRIEETVQNVREHNKDMQTEKDLKRELEIMEDMNNPHYNV